jgi:hypothetical protein
MSTFDSEFLKPPFDQLYSSFGSIHGPKAVSPPNGKRLLFALKAWGIAMFGLLMPLTVAPARACQAIAEPAQVIIIHRAKTPAHGNGLSLREGPARDYLLILSTF